MKILKKMLHDIIHWQLSWTCVNVLLPAGGTLQNCSPDFPLDKMFWWCFHDDDRCVNCSNMRSRCLSMPHKCCGFGKLETPPGFPLGKDLVICDPLLLISHIVRKPPWLQDSQWQDREPCMNSTFIYFESHVVWPRHKDQNRLLRVQMFTTTRTKCIHLLLKWVFHFSLNSVSGDRDTDGTTGMQ